MPERSNGSGSSRLAVATPASLRDQGHLLRRAEARGSGGGPRRDRLGDVERGGPGRGADVRVVEVQVDVVEGAVAGRRVGHRRAEIRPRHRHDRLRQGARAERLDHLCALARPLRGSAGAVQRIVGIDLRAELLRLGPILALAAREREELRCEQLEALDVAALGVDLEQLGADREALGIAAHRLLEDLLGLQVATIREVDVGLGDRVDVADRVELRQRVGHRRRAARGVAGVDALAAAGAEERVGLQAALEERGLAAVLLGALGVAVPAVAEKQHAERTETEVERVAAQ